MSTKASLLAILQQHEGTTLSGELLAKQLRVSRAAVSKAVRSLREDGYVIESKTNSGYRLVSDFTPLSEQEISSHLATEMDVEVLPTVDSTNSELKRRLIGGLSQRFLLTAEEQTGGRGRQGRSFYSPKGTGIYMTILLHPHVAVNVGVSVTTRVSVAVCRAIEKVCGLQVGIKWVNDLFYSGRKICGILVESVSDFESGMINSLVIGIGMNTATVSFPDSIAATAGSLKDVRVDRNRLIAEITNCVVSELEDFSDLSYLEEYRRRSIVLNRSIRFIRNEETFEGVVTAIDDEGRLHVRLADGSESVLSSGEISVRLND